MGMWCSSYGLGEFQVYNGIVIETVLEPGARKAGVHEELHEEQDPQYGKFTKNIHYIILQRIRIQSPIYSRYVPGLTHGTRGSEKSQ